MSSRLSVDVGGTFTDLVIGDGESIEVYKAPTTTSDRTLGIFDALELAAHSRDTTVPALLRETEAFIHGTTTATNALITGETARVGLICTRGFRDILTFREGGRSQIFNLKLDYPEPFVPRSLTLPVTERVNAQGEVLIPLDEDDVREVIGQLRERGVEVVAVALLWSIANPVHEKRIGEILAEEWPGVPYVLSSDLNPTIREYQRTCSTVIDAAVKPLMQAYLRRLERRLLDAKFGGSPFILSSTGGMITVDEAAHHPIFTIDSGPTMGPVAGNFYAQELNRQDIITCDMGGTSFDVTAIRGGSVLVSRETLVAGLKLGIPRVDVRSIGAGGGSIAWVDSGHLLHVGPQSAGSEPGPACYGRGGELPTVTDSNLLLGFLNPHNFLGGRMRIEATRAEKAVRKEVAAPLGLSLQEACYAIFTTVNHNMIAAIEDITVREGVNPRESLLVGGGGAAGIHMAAIARELGMSQILVPQSSGAFSAIGGLIADIKGEFAASFFTTSRDFDYGGVNRTLEELEGRAVEFLDRAKIAEPDRRLEYFAEARYPYQVWELEVPLPGHRITQENLPALVNEFHRVHEAVHAVNEPTQYVEVVSWRIRSIGAMPKALRGLRRSATTSASSSVSTGKRKAYLRELGGATEVPLYDGLSLPAGCMLEGPAILEEPTATVLVPPRSTATVTPLGSYVIDLLP